MTNNELCYLILVLGSFAAFTISVAAARLRYVSWLRGTGSSDRHVTAPTLEDAAVAPTRVARAA